MSIEMKLFETRQMLSQISEMFPANNFLLNTFFREVNVTESEHIDIEVEKGKRKMAPFVHPLRQGKIDTREGYTAKSMKPAYVKPKRSSTAADYLAKFIGENPYAPMSRAEKAAMLQAKDLSEMLDQIARREEWMAAQQLTSGLIPVVGEGVNVTIDLGIDTSHVLANTDLIDNGWATASSCAPLDDLEALQLLISKDSGLYADVAVFGATAWQKFAASAQVVAEDIKVDSSRATGTSVERPANVKGAIYKGTARGIDLWVYNEWYLDDADVLQPMIPAKKMFLASSQARAIRHYGAIMDVEVPGGAPVRVWPKTWVEKDPSQRILLLQSAPLPIYHQVDGIVIAQVVA